MTQPQGTGAGLPGGTGPASNIPHVPSPTIPAPDGYETPRTAQEPADSSLGDLLGDVSQDISTLMRQELELAKAELRESASRAGKGAGMLVGASEAARFVLLFLSLALWAALASLMAAGWAAVIVAILWAVVGAILGIVGKKNITTVRGLPETTETLQEIPSALTPGKDPS